MTGMVRPVVMSEQASEQDEPPRGKRWAANGCFTACSSSRRRPGRQEKGGEIKLEISLRKLLEATVAPLLATFKNLVS